MIGQHFDPPHPIRPLQAAIHRIGWSTATTPPPPPPPPRRNHPFTIHFNLCASCCLIFVHPVVSQMIDAVVLLSHLFKPKSCQMIPGRYLITLKLH